MVIFTFWHILPILWFLLFKFIKALKSQTLNKKPFCSHQLKTRPHILLTVNFLRCFILSLSWTLPVLSCSKRNRQFQALVEIWTSMCPRSISVRCTGSTAKLRIPSMGYPEILYLAIKLFIELITFMWWQKIIEKGPSCPAMTKKTSLSISCPGGGCSELWVHAKWLSR